MSVQASFTGDAPTHATVDTDAWREASKGMMPLSRLFGPGRWGCPAVLILTGFQCLIVMAGLVPAIHPQAFVRRWPAEDRP